MLVAAGYDNVWINPRDEKLSRPDLLSVIRGAHAFIATPADVQLDAEFFDAAGDQLRIVSNYAVGVDNLDLAEARRRGVLVGYTPDPVSEPTADAAWMLLLAAARRAREGLDLARSGAWTGVRPLDPPGKRIVARTFSSSGRGGSARRSRAAGQGGG